MEKNKKKKGKTDGRRPFFPFSDVQTRHTRHIWVETVKYAPIFYPRYRMKPDAYRQYYQENREKILEANKERRRIKRQDETQRLRLREQERVAHYQRRAKDIKDAFLECAERAEGEWKTVYQKLATLHNLGSITAKQFEFLLTLRSAEE